MDHFFIVGFDLLSIISIETFKFIRINRLWETVFGYTTDELLKISFFDFVHPEDIPMTNTALKEIEDTGALLSFINRFKCKNGQYKFIEWNSIINKNGTVFSSRVEPDGFKPQTNM